MSMEKALKRYFAPGVCAWNDINRYLLAPLLKIYKNLLHYLSSFTNENPF